MAKTGEYDLSIYGINNSLVNELNNYMLDDKIYTLSSFHLLTNGHLQENIDYSIFALSGIINFHMMKLTNAIIYFKKCTEIKNNFSSKYYLATSYYHIRNYNKTKNICKNILSDEKLDPLNKFFLYSLMSMNLKEIQQNDSSLYYSNKALEIAKQLPELDNSFTAILHNNKGFAYFNIGDYEKARLNFEKALTIMLQRLDKNMKLINIASAYLNIGICLALQDEYESSIPLFKKAIMYQLKSNEFDIHVLYRSYINLGALYLKEDIIDSALYYEEKALVFANKYFGYYSRFVAQNFSRIGMYYESLNEIDKSIQNNLKSLRINLFLNDSSIQNTGTSCYNLARLYNKTNKLDSAYYYINESIKIDTLYNSKDHPTTLKKFTLKNEIKKTQHITKHIHNSSAIKLIL